MQPEPNSSDVTEVRTYLEQMPAPGERVPTEGERAMLQALHRATEESMNAAMGVTGWTYRDVPWTTSALWDTLFEVLGTGADDVKIVTFSTRDVVHDGKKQKAIRGSILISPQAIERLKTHVEEKEERTKKAQS